MSVNKSRWGNSLAAWESSSLCCPHFTACQSVMTAVCIISFFPSLQAQNWAAWVDEKSVWWQTKEQCEFCHTRRCKTRSLYLKCNKPKQNRKKNPSISTLNILRFLFCNLPKWKHFLLENLYDLFKRKVIPFQFFSWMSMTSLSCSLLHFPPSFFPFLSFCCPHYPLSHKKNRKKNKVSKQWKKYICFSVGIRKCLKINIKISNFKIILNIKLEKRCLV